MHISDIASEMEARKCDVFSVLTFYLNESDRYVIFVLQHVLDLFFKF